MKLLEKVVTSKFGLSGALCFVIYDDNLEYEMKFESKTILTSYKYANVLLFLFAVAEYKSNYQKNLWKNKYPAHFMITNKCRHRWRRLKVPYSIYVVRSFE